MTNPYTGLPLSQRGIDRMQALQADPNKFFTVAAGQLARLIPVAEALASVEHMSDDLHTAAFLEIEAVISHAEN